jgi:hypothetical protein
MYLSIIGNAGVCLAILALIHKFTYVFIPLLHNRDFQKMSKSRYLLIDTNTHTYWQTIDIIASICGEKCIRGIGACDTCLRLPTWHVVGYVISLLLHPLLFSFYWHT